MYRHPVRDQNCTHALHLLHPDKMIPRLGTLIYYLFRESYMEPLTRVKRLLFFYKKGVMKMDGDYISRKEHEEFSARMSAENKRLEDENNRQNHRIDDLEDKVSEIHSIAASVEKLAVNMQSMLKEQEKQGDRLEKQGERLETLESRDGETWRKVTGHILTTVIGIAVGYVFKMIGM